MFLPLIRDGRHCGWHGAPRFLSLARCRRLGWTLTRPLTVPLLAPSCCWCFILHCFFSLALRYLLTLLLHLLTLLLHSPLFHIHITSKFSTSAQSALYAASSRSLVMRALGGAITSPCSNDPESRRPSLTIFGLSPHLLFNCWMLLDSPIQITALSGRLLVLFCVYTWLVQLPLYYRIICIVNSFVSADRRATARTTTSLSHAAIRQKKCFWMHQRNFATTTFVEPCSH